MKISKKELMPILVLAIITTATTILLVVMNNLVKTDETEISGKLKEKCIELMGEGEFTMFETQAELPREIQRIIIHNESGAVAFQILVNGYNRGGLNLLIAMNDDGSVRDLLVYQNTETPTIGTKVNEREFLDNFVGRNSEVRIVRKTSRADDEVAAITRATMSSRGVADAVNIAIHTYELLFLGGFYAEEN
jgi:electron transport complex protein RnfG